MVTVFSVKKVYGQRYMLCFWMLHIVLSVSLYAANSLSMLAHASYYGVGAANEKTMHQIDIARIPCEGADDLSLLDIVLTSMHHAGGVNYALALENAQKADAEGDLYGSYILACLYYDGRAVAPEEGVPQRAFDQRRYASAFALAEKAAKGGVAGASYLLAICYYAGRGVPRNKDMATQHVNKALERGYLPAMKLQKFIERMPEE
ncbi:MAG: hypothetical protein WCJ17_02045 [bacterium]